MSQAALNILSHTPAYSSMEATSLLSHQGQKPGNHQAHVTVQGRQDSRVISMPVVYYYQENVQERSTAFRKEDAELVDMLISRCWQGIQVEISNSQLEMTLYMTDCWSRLQKWKLKSFSEKLKLWFDRNHTVSKSGNTQEHSAVEDRPSGERERGGHWGGMAFGVCFLAS